MKKIIIITSVLLSVCACQNRQSLPAEISLLDKAAFEKKIDSENVSLYTLRSANGLTMQVTNFGGRIVSLWAADKNGKYEDVVLGFENIDRYVNVDGERFLGPVVGRYANRIAKGQFEIDGIKYQLPINNNGQTLHGGLKGLDLVAWHVDKVSDNEIQMSYTSPDGSEGFPGTLALQMTYTLLPNNELKISYKGTTDKPTVINLSNHSLFNLKGEGNGTITDHILTINASYTTPIDSVLIPTGELASVEGSPFDFRQPTTIGSRINEPNEQLKNSSGYDHNWVIDRKTKDSVEFIASVYEPVSGRLLEVWSDQPGLQFYSGNFFNGQVAGKYSRLQKYREALALETQHFPDSPNHPQFPSTRLNPGETYTQTCIYKFKVK